MNRKHDLPWYVEDGIIRESLRRTGSLGFLERTLRELCFESPVWVDFSQS